MSLHLGSWSLLAGSLWALSGSAAAATQSSQQSAREPLFFAVALSPHSQDEALRAPVLQRPVSLSATDSTVGDALKQVIRQADLEILYSAHVVPLDRPVRIETRNITVAAALRRILAGLAVDVSITSTGALALVPQVTRRSPASASDTGWIAGRVTDSATAAPLAGATITIDDRRTAVTDATGWYRLSGVAPGQYTVRARYIGYAPGRLVVTVRAKEEATGDFALVKLPQELDQLVVTGTIVPTEVKALPTPLTVITEEDIAAQRPPSVQELFRKAVPGAVGWNYSSAPYQTELSVRGASSLTPSTPSMKIFVDGVDVAAAIYSQLDPESIERIEVIRGPQAAAIYGSEAIGGVIQVLTKRGAEGDRPQVNAEAAMGVVQTGYTQHKTILRQEYKAAVRGGGRDIGYHLGGGYSHLDNWLPNGEVSREASPSVYGGVTYAKGSIGVDLSARHLRTLAGANLANPELHRSGFVPLSKPSFQPVEYQNQTVGGRFSLTPNDWWSSSITLGLDRYGYDLAQSRPRRTTPADTLLLVANEAATKTSIAVQTSLKGELRKDLSGSLTAGFDHWRRPLSNWFAFEATGTTGTIETGPTGIISATRNETTNTGYFTQAQVGLDDALFLTAGLRAERNSEFGDSLGVPLLPRVGLAYVRPVGTATVKLRGSWGRAIRPTASGRKSGYVSGTSIQLPNPRLGPERQQGWDGGVDVTLGGSASVSVTYYHQRAENLVDAVVIALEPVYTQQFQNVGSVRNTGLEVEGSLSSGLLTLQGQYAYTRSRIDQLSPTYAGDLRGGDTPLLRPKHTAGLSVTLGRPFASTSVTGGIVYVGSRTNYDYLALYRCFGGTGACRETFRDYLKEYPEFVKMNVSVFQRVTSNLSGILLVDNIWNAQPDEVSNDLPRRGRSIMAGLRAEY